MEIYLVRHTSLNIEGSICYGQSNVDLANTFDSELSIIKAKLPDLENAIFYTSPLKRCFSLAFRITGKTPVIDNRIIEMNFGEWELQNWNLLSGDIFKKWCLDFVNTQTPNGESYLDLYKRSIDFWNEVITQQHEKVVIVTHGGVIKAILAHVLGIPLVNSALIDISFGSISKIRINGTIQNIEFINR